MPRLSDETIMEVYKDEASPHEIAKKYGLLVSTVQKIKRRSKRRYRDLTAKFLTKDER